MEPQDPDDKTLEETSGSSRFFSFSETRGKAASDSEVQDPENRQGIGMNCNVGDNPEIVGSVFKNLLANDGTEKKIEEENDIVKSHGDDSVKKIEISGDHLSLIVDFSGPVGDTKRDSLVDYNRDGSIVDVAKENEVGDQTQKFSVGDFVWVSTKSHNWWPGKVSDLNPDQRDSLKVSYFGQSHVAWCSPSQLKPFHENFTEMVKQSKARSYSGTIEKAMADFGKSLKLGMTCSCISKDNNQFRLFSDFSIYKLKPKDFLAQLKNLAKLVPMPGMLELTVMQSRLSAFYSSVGHKQVSSDQLHENSVEQSSGLIEEKLRKQTQERSKSRKRVREKDSKIRVEKDNDNGSHVKNEKSVASRGRKRSKYLSFPYVNSSETVDEKVRESTDQFIGFPSVVNGSSTKSFQKEWFRKFISEENDASAKAQLENVSTACLLSELKCLAMDWRYARETEKFDLIKWFVSKFRISIYHDEFIYCKNTICATNLTVAKDSCTDPEQNTLKRKKKSKIKSLSVLSDVKTNYSAISLSMKDSPGTKFPQTPVEKSPLEDIPKKPATKIPDLNGGDTMLSFTAPDHSKVASFSSLPDVRKSVPTMLNFQAMGPCSINPIPYPELTFDQQSLNGNPSTVDTNAGQKKRKRRSKEREEPQKATLGVIPDLNGTTTETTNFLAPQEKPKQKRKRRTKAEIMNAEIAKGTTSLLLKFAPEISMPSKDDLTSMFSGFGPLNASETQLLKEPGGAKVAFVSSADAVEAVRSLEKNNLFGETLISFRLQPKLTTFHPNLATKIPVKPVGPMSKAGDASMSVDHIRQNLVMMTSMLEKAGHSLSQEMRVQLEGEIKRLLEKVSSMPSSSSS